MSYQPRTVVPHRPHLVTLRGNNQRRLFVTREDLVHFFAIAASARTEARCAILAAAPTPRVVELVLEPARASSLSRFVKILAERYAQQRNARRDDSGRLFETNFVSKQLSEEDVGPTIAAIELAVTADRAAARMASWSTYGLHAGTVEFSLFPARLWTPSRWYLALGATARERQAAYRQLFATERAALMRHLKLERPPRDRRRVERPDGNLAT